VIHRVVVVGSGSAGRRHAAELRRVLPGAELVVVRRADSEQPLEPWIELDADVAHDLDVALRSSVDLAVVASPATAHEQHVACLVAHDVPTLVEKPLAHSSAAARRLAASADDSGTPLVIGYHLRVSETVVALRTMLRAGLIGAVQRFDLRVGQHLGGWRSTQPAARSVSARAELGGGVLLELSHELDALIWLLGPVASVGATLRRDGAPTDGIVETVADLDVRLASGLHGRVHLDMVSDPAFRCWQLDGERGTLVADLLAGTVQHRTDGMTQELHRAAPGERDRAERSVIADLLGVTSGRTTQLCTPDEAVDVLELVEAARRSAASGRSESPKAGEVLGR
jgi:hypothetical protein